MNLQTEMVETNTGRFVPYAITKVGQTAPTSHDAAFAHAMVQAMNTLEPYHRGAYQELRAEASRIMEEWKWTD